MNLNFPVIERPSSTGGSRDLVVILSGDGGWGITERSLGRAFPRRGFSVVGLNSLRYFWRTRTPDGAAADLARMIEKYSKEWGRTRVTLMGYSFGADVLPFMINRLPPPEREKVALVVLLGLGTRADFRFHVSDWLGRPSRDALPVLPELEKLRGTPVLCLYGEREKGCPCRDLDPALVTAIPRKGGHLILGGWEGIVDRVVEGLEGGGSPGEETLGDGGTRFDGRTETRARVDPPSQGRDG